MTTRTGNDNNNFVDGSEPPKNSSTNPLLYKLTGLFSGEITTVMEQNTRNDKEACWCPVADATHEQAFSADDAGVDDGGFPDATKAAREAMSAASPLPRVQPAWPPGRITPEPIPSADAQYLQLVKMIMVRGETRPDRTGVGTLSMFGAQMRLDLRQGFPLLTTKKMPFMAVVHELLWFIAGSTSSTQLAERGTHIWDANGTRAFLDQRGLRDRAEGDLGPIYGFQWRHFGAAYRGAGADYRGQGIDQLRNVIHQLRNDPFSRRIVMSAWNPPDLDQMALPPCHVLVQFYVSVDGTLSTHLYQRSGDMGLGVAFNMASYALLTHMLAQACNLNGVGELILTLGDAHVYSSHVIALQQQLIRRPFPAPTLKLDPSVRDIDAFQAHHIRLENYQCHERLPMPMAV